ncbi:MAG: hypothetical protein F4087_12255 [Gemmatimonadetes bacterium]|nr:hypothetical protein [Gemmatimonadota bacterium]MYJ69265.1 hypothetical protein [Gemmatimonadota bacterium]
MTEAQKVQLAAATARKELRALALTEDATAEAIAEATTKVDNLEARAAVLTAAEEAENGPDKLTTEDAEGREFRRLEGRVEVRRYIGAAMDGKGVDGAEGEYNAALKMGAGSFPLRILAPPREARATTNVDAGVSQGTWLDRLFADTAAMHLGISFRSVGAGVASYPTTTAGASAAQRGRSEAIGDAAWTVGVKEIKPTRNGVRAVFSSEDAARLSGLEDSLRRDLRAALTEGIDRAVFVGDAGANENAGDITGLQTHASVAEVEINQTNKVLASNNLALFVGLIDGQYAAGLNDLRLVCAVGCATLWESTILAVDNETASMFKTLGRFLRDAGLSWKVRGGIETATAAGDFGAFIGLGRGIDGAAVAPVWDNAKLIRDPYTGAAKGEVSLTLQTLWGFDLPRAANFRRLKFIAD